MSTEEVATNQKVLTQELWRLAETDRVEQVEALLNRGVDINASNVHGMTALMRAAEHGRERMVRALLDNGADPNASRNDKFTALLLASFFGHEEIVRILIEHGADINAESRFETSAKMWATCRNFYDVADYLEHPESESDENDYQSTSDEIIAAEVDRPKETLDVEAVAASEVQVIQRVPSRSSLNWAITG